MKTKHFSPQMLLIFYVFVLQVISGIKDSNFQSFEVNCTVQIFMFNLKDQSFLSLLITQKK